VFPQMTDSMQVVPAQRDPATWRPVIEFSDVASNRQFPIL